MDRTLYERPEKRARLTILDDNDSRVGAYDGVSSSLVIVVSRLRSDHICSKEAGGHVFVLFH